MNGRDPRSISVQMYTFYVDLVDNFTDCMVAWDTSQQTCLVFCIFLIADKPHVAQNPVNFTFWITFWLMAFRHLEWAIKCWNNRVDIILSRIWCGLRQSAVSLCQQTHMVNSLFRLREAQSIRKMPRFDGSCDFDKWTFPFQKIPSSPLTCCCARTFFGC